MEILIIFRQKILRNMGNTKFLQKKAMLIFQFFIINLNDHQHLKYLISLISLCQVHSFYNFPKHGLRLREIGIGTFCELLL